MLQVLIHNIFCRYLESKNSFKKMQALPKFENIIPRLHKVLHWAHFIPCLSKLQNQQKTGEFQKVPFCGWLLNGNYSHCRSFPPTILTLRKLFSWNRQNQNHWGKLLERIETVFREPFEHAKNLHRFWFEFWNDKFVCSWKNLQIVRIVTTYTNVHAQIETTGYKFHMEPTIVCDLLTCAVRYGLLTHGLMAATQLRPILIRQNEILRLISQFQSSHLVLISSLNWAFKIFFE